MRRLTMCWMVEMGLSRTKWARAATRLSARSRVAADELLECAALVALAFRLVLPATG